ncbi:MAG: hypothetical protein Q4G02_02570 [bacterium]|nr:hypothetical protein [bacterium]
MKKEILLVIALGICVALGVTFFIYQKQQNNNELNSPIASASPTAENLVTLPEKPADPINLTFPENEAVFEDKAITVIGTTTANTPVVIFINQKDFFTQSDADGNFQLDVNLESGSNIIKGVIVDENGQQQTNQIIVVYSNKSLEETLVSEEEIKE